MMYRVQPDWCLPIYISPPDSCVSKFNPIWPKHRGQCYRKVSLIVQCFHNTLITFLISKEFHGDRGDSFKRAERHAMVSYKGVDKASHDKAEAASDPVGIQPTTCRDPPLSSFASNSTAAAGVRVSVSAWQSHATINQICGRKRRKWCGLTEASQWRKPNYTARRTSPHHHLATTALFLSLSLLSSLPSRPLTSSFPQWGFSVCCHYTSPHIDGLCWLQSHTRCICSVSLDVMCSNSGPLTLKLSIDFEISDLSGDKGYR